MQYVRSGHAGETLEGGGCAMIIPLTHENMEARRWPILTTLLVVVNVLFFVFITVGARDQQRLVSVAQRELVSYWQEHPELNTPPSLEELGLKKPHELHGRDRPIDPADQAELDDRGTRFVTAIRQSPYRTWGYVPKDNNLVGLFTHMFVHGGIMHLVFNMWFMWLCACNLEDRWGRLVFLPMYFVAGIVAVLTHRAMDPESIIPCIGASGAVAGAMGAFLVAFAKTRIRFFYWIVRPGTFSAPAWIMLPLWVTGEIASMVLGPKGGDGTAHGAHVGGFFFGVFFAAVLLVSGLDKRLDAAAERAVTTTQDPQLAHASALIDQNRIAEAIGTLEAYLTRTPSSVDGYLELLRAATAASDTRRMGVAYGRLIDLYVRVGSFGAAFDLHAEARQKGLVGAIPMRSRTELANRLVAANMADLGLGVYAAIVQEGIKDLVTARAALTYAKLLLGMNRHGDAARVIDTLESSNPVPEFAGEIATLRSQVRGTSIAL